MQQESKTNQKKLIIIIGIIITFIIMLFISIKVIYNRINDSEINLLIAPKSASVKIDNSSYSTEGTYKLPSGKHTITISKENFETVTEEINLTQGETYYYYNYIVYPDGDTSWYSEHEEDSRLLEVIIPEIELKHIKTLEQQNPIILQLPINVEEYNNQYSEIIKYSISYKINIDDSITILLTDYTGGKKEEMLNRIRSLGFNPEDLFILYEDKSEPEGWAKAYDN